MDVPVLGQAPRSEQMSRDLADGFRRECIAVNIPGLYLVDFSRMTETHEIRYSKFSRSHRRRDQRMLNIEHPDQLRDYLVATGRIPSDASFAAEPLSGGVSARTVRVRWGAGNTPWVLKQALPRLRVESEWRSDPERIHREAAGLRWLGRILPPGATPRFLFEDGDHHLLAMEAVRRPHRNWKEMLLAGDLQSDHVREFASLLATIHLGEPSPDVKAAFSDRRYFESLRVEPYYAFTASRVPEAARFMESLIADTRAPGRTLVHGDYSPKNVLVRDGRLILLDHEVMHLGDPAFDLGFSLTHLLAKAHHLSWHRATFRGAAKYYWVTYRATLGDPGWVEGLEERAARHALGCLLARVAGRSPLEYLSPEEIARQGEAAIALMDSPPASIPELIDAFLDRV